MSQHFYPTSNDRLPYTLLGHSTMSSATGRPSRPEVPHRPTDINPVNLLAFDQASSFASGYTGGLGMEPLNSAQRSTSLADDRNRFVGMESQPLYQFFYGADGPWNQENSRVRGHPEALLSSFTGFRETATFSECATSVVPTDSGYGSQAKHSVGIPSVNGDLDRTPEALLQLAEIQIPNGTASLTRDVNHWSNTWSPGSLARPDGVPANNAPTYACSHCERTYRSQSDLKKHVASYEKRHKCPETGCHRSAEGFGTQADLKRHLDTVHKKGITKYRCHHCRSKTTVGSRADNFRSHLKRAHKITIGAEDSLREYYHHPPNPEDLLNVGVAPELILPSDQGSSTGPRWSGLHKDTNVHMSSAGSDPGDAALDCSDVSISSPVDVRSQDATGPGNHTASIFSGSQYSEIHGKSQEIYGRDLASCGNTASVDHHRQHSQITDVLFGESPRYIRPRDLNYHTPDASPPASCAGDHESDVMGLDNEDDADDEPLDDHATRHHNSEFRSVSTSATPATRHTTREEFRRRFTGWDRPGPLSDSNFSSAEAVNQEIDAEREPSQVKSWMSRGTGTAYYNKVDTTLSDQSSSSASEDLDKINDGVEAAFQKIKAQFGESEVEKLLSTCGFVKPKEPQARSRKLATVQSSPSPLTIPCTQCDKRFNRRCELKKHLTRHEKPYGCTQCHQKFGSKNDWKRHENGQHFQHEIWKCDLDLKAPVSGTCNKVCHRRETFKAHLVSHHGLDSGPQLDEKLEKCRVNRLGEAGEARFWCGFCREIIEHDQTVEGASAFINARYDHIDDHYHGRNGRVKREARQWLRADAGMGEAKATGDRARKAAGKTENMDRMPEVKKRTRQGEGRTPKRTKVSSPREDIMWYCCECNNAWSFANVASCINCPTQHVRCNDCKLEKVDGQDDDM